MKSLKLERKRGYSLVEMVLYITILVFMVIVVINIIFSFVGSEKKLKSTKSLENSTTFSLERIGREVREASSVDTSLSVLGSSPGDLVLNSTTASGTSRKVEFYLSNGVLHLKEDGVDTGALSQADSKITNLTFTFFNGTSSAAVRTQMTLESGTSTYYKSINVYSTNALRGSI